MMIPILIGCLLAFRTIDPAVVAEAAGRIDGEGAILLMRHGEQEKSEAILQLPTPAEQKIAMMQAPENGSAPATEESLQEWAGALEALALLQESTGLAPVIESSANLRAKQPAERAAARFGEPLLLRPVWNCIDYLPREDLLQILPDGTVPWQRDKINAAAGPMAFERIVEGVREELALGQNLRIAITHTQQIQAASELLGLPTTRLDYYGFLLITSTGAYVYPHGFFKN